MRNMIDVETVFFPIKNSINSCIEILNRLFGHRSQFAKTLNQKLFEFVTDCLEGFGESLVLTIGKNVRFKMNMKRRGCVQVCDNPVICQNQERKVPK